MFSHQDYFLVRSPSIPTELMFNELQGIQNKQTILKNWFSNNFVKSAINLSSRELFFRLENRIKNNKNLSEKEVNSLLKFYIKCHTSTAPFGLFSWVRMVNLGDTSDLLFEYNYKMYIRISNNALFFFCNQIDLIDNDIVFLNPTVNIVNEQYRYIDKVYSGKGKLSYILSAFERSDILDEIVSDVGERRSLYSISKLLQNEFSIEESNEIIKTLIESSFLLIKSKFNLIGRRNDIDFLKLASEVLPPDAKMKIKFLIDSLTWPKSLAEVTAGSINEIEKSVKEILPDHYAGDLLHVDMENDTKKELSFSRLEIEKMLRNFYKISCILKSNVEPAQLRSFKTHFSERFKDGPVCLLTALDDEIGIGYSRFAQNKNNVLSTVKIRQEQTPRSKVISQFGRVILNKIIENVGTKTIFINDEDLDSIHTSDIKLPGNFCIHFSVVKDELENFLYHVTALNGPSFANTQGRFLYMNEAHEQHVIDGFQLEAEMYNKAILAEIVHAPHGDKAINVITRPKLRDYEIPIVMSGCSPNTRQIELSDLYLYMEDNALKLWSKKNCCEVIPRMATAHNARYKALGIYNFLHDLQLQGLEFPVLGLDDALTELRYTPRICYKNHIISPRRWNVSKKDISKIKNKEDIDNLFKPVETPRFVTVSRDGNKYVEETETLSFIQLLNKLREQPGEFIAIEEYIFYENESAVKTDGLNTANEVLLPVTRKDFRYEGTKVKFSEENFRSITKEKDFYKSPFTDWLSIYIYGSEAALDQLLASSLNDFLKSSDEFRYFFIRYNIPANHIRLRLKRNTQNPWPVSDLTKYFDDLVKSNKISKYEYNAYIQERFKFSPSGEEILDSEQIFFEDSRCVLNIISNNKVDENERFYVALLSVYCFLSEIYSDKKSTLASISISSKMYATEYIKEAGFYSSLSLYYRKEIGRISMILNENDQKMLENGVYREIKDRSLNIAQNVKSIVDMHRTCPEKLKVTIAHHIHLIINRLLPNKQRIQEAIIYEILIKYLKSKIALEQSDLDILDHNYV